jgi:hemoglobin/transferrin/lactoferrin receptor protein
MKTLFYLGVFLVGQLFSHAQNLSVLDADSGLSLAGVTLTSKTAEIYAVTDRNGRAEISAFRNADSIEIRFLGYSTQRLTFKEIVDLNFVVRLISANLSLDEVVISATRWRQSKITLPSSIATVSPKDVALQNPQTAADLLGISGKVFIQKSQQGGGSPMIRGFATNRLIYVVDGVRMNTAIFRGGNLQNVINLDPFSTESTEILFGPGSVIYGSDAIGGVMSFQTLTPAVSKTGSLAVSGSTTARYASANGEKTAHFDVRAGWKKWAAVTSLSRWNYDDLRQGSHGPEDYIKDYYVAQENGQDVIITQRNPLLQIPTGYTQANLMQKIRFQPDAAWDIQYGLHYSETSPYGRYDRHNRKRNGTARYAQWDYGPQKWIMNNISVSHFGNRLLYDEMVLRLARQDFTESRISRNLNNPIRETQTEKVIAYSANLDFRKAAGTSHNLFYGVEWVRNNVNSEGMDKDIFLGIKTNGPSRYPSAHWNSLAAYFSDEFTLSSKWTLQSGIRYNLFSLKADFSNNLSFYPFPFEQSSFSDGSLTGHLGGVYRPNNQWIFKGNLGTAFRSPNVDDLGKVFDSEPGAVTVPNPDVKAEYAWNADVALAKVFSDRVKIELSGYYTLLEHALVRRDFQLGGLDSIVYDGILSRVQAIQNAAVARVYGLQTGVELKLPKGFIFSTDLNWQRGEEELDDGTISPSRHAPPFFGVSRLTYRSEKWVLQGYSQYQGKLTADQLPEEEKSKTEIYAKDDLGYAYAPAWTTWNIKANYTLSNSVTIGVGLENITDQRYRPYSSGVSGAGRNAIISLDAKF